MNHRLVIQDLLALIERKERYFENNKTSNNSQIKAREIELKVLNNALSALVDDSLSEDVIKNYQQKENRELRELILKLGIISQLNYSHKLNMTPREIYILAKGYKFNISDWEKLRKANITINDYLKENSK